MALHRQKAGQKRGRMIPLLQLVLGGPGFAPMPAEAGPVEVVPEAEEFSLLMDQITVASADGAVPLAMVPVIPMPQLPLPPQSLPQAAPAAPLPDRALAEVTTEPAGLDLEIPIETPVPLHVMPPVQQPDKPIAPLPVTALPDTGSSDPFAAPLPLGDIAKSTAAAPPPPVTLNEVVFLARIVPNAEPAVPLAETHIVKATRTAAMVMPMVSALPARPTPPPDPDEGVHDKPAIGQAVIPNVAHALIVAEPSAVTLSKAKSDPDPLSPPEPQVIALSALDRPAQAAPSVPIALPASVTAALMPHAPQATLGPVEVVLNPEELGKVRFEIHHQGDQVKVVLAVERPETLDLLRRHADQLVQEFRASGFSGATLSFGHWGGQQQDGAAAQTARAEPDFVATEAQRLPPSPLSFAPSPGLNLRL